MSILPIGSGWRWWVRLAIKLAQLLLTNKNKPTKESKK